MDSTQLQNLIDQRIEIRLNSFNDAPVSRHVHNGYDAQQLNPATSLSGFPVVQVTDASVAPVNRYDNGEFVFLVDNKGGTPHYYFWAYLVYQNASNAQVSAWKGVQLS